MSTPEVNPLDLPDDQLDNFITQDTGTITEEVKEDGLQDKEEGQDSTEEDANEAEDVANSSTSESTEASTEAPEAPESDSEQTSKESSGIDYETEYKKLLAPFRANNKDMQVDSVDDARQLMSMGANYNKKMAAIKPHLKIVKMLDNNGLLDEAKLSFLIDVSKKDPVAISKLLKDSGIDPLDVDTNTADGYTPKNYQVADAELELDSVLEDIKDSPSFNTTADVLGNKWDASSKKVLLDNPQLIKVINSHIEAGIFQKITSVVERERMLGRLTGVSDIEAYKLVGDAINAQSGFQDTQQSKPALANQVPNKSDTSLKDRKKAASSTKTKPTASANTEFNPLSMSDEEFERIASSKYM